MAGFSTVARGAEYAADYRLFFHGPNGIISPWHDIPLRAGDDGQLFHMVCEVPRWTNAKMEIATTEKMNPIKQDVKKGQMRFVNNCFPHHGYIWNYGALPQTWEKPTHVDKDTNAAGDNDPIDVCEIGSAVCARGQVKTVKVVGTLALIDEGETDWKLIAIDSHDALADSVNCIEDVEQHFPGLLRATVEWFRIYKIPTGKPANAFAFGGQYKDKDYALKVIEETHNFWRQLVQESDTEMATENVTVAESARRLDVDAAQAVLSESAPPSDQQHAIPADVNHWHFISNL